jgi:HPt (histidine-containing phosphotransfer) domain-containing protein
VANTIDPAITDAMNRLWAKFLPQMESRVTTLQNAAASLAAGTLTGELQEQASAEAHKLAGVLGTFGLHEGTELAREAENIYQGNLQTGLDTAGRLTAIAARLRVLIANRD